MHFVNSQFNVMDRLFQTTLKSIAGWFWWPTTRMWSSRGSTKIYFGQRKKGARYLKISHKQKCGWPPLPRAQSPKTVQSRGEKVIKWNPGSFTPCNRASHQQLQSGKASRQTRARLWINDLPESAEAHLDWFHGLASAQSESECTYAELILIPNWPISQHAPSTWAGERRANTEWQSAQPKNGSWLGDTLFDSLLLKWPRRGNKECKNNQKNKKTNDQKSTKHCSHWLDSQHVYWAGRVKLTNWDWIKSKYSVSVSLE